MKPIKVTTSTITKVTVTLTRQQLWENFFLTWVEIAWDDSESIDFTKFRIVADSLLIRKDSLSLRKLFREGYTCMLLGSAIEHFDKSDIHREVIITHKDTGSLIIPHEDINI